MLDIKLIRENPEKINELLKRRNPELSIDTIIAIDADRRKVQAQADELRAKRKSESQKIGMMKKNGENTDAIQEEVRKLGDEVKALEEKNTVKIGENLFNRFESVISQKEIFYIKDKLINLGANGAIMSGSGSSVFGIFEDSEKASGALEALKKEYTQVFLCRPIKI